MFINLLSKTHFVDSLLRKTPLKINAKVANTGLRQLAAI